MKSTLEALEGNKVKLSIELEEAEFDREIDAAFRKIAKEIRLPGFRPGKAPRQVVEARIGKDAARTQAIQDAIPEYLSRAVREHDVDIIATPDVELKEGQDTGVVKFDATCEIRPEITVPGYTGLRIELSSPVVTDENLEEVIIGERRRHGVLTDIDRAAATGDYVIVDLAGLRDGEPVVGLNTEDWTYEIGRGWVAPGFDDQLIGAVAGAELTFTATPNGTEIPADFVVKVQKVQTLDLPELTDEWVQNTIPEFDSVAAWRDSTLERLTTGRLNQMRNSVVDKVTDGLAELVDIEAPESMVNGDLQGRVQNTISQFQQQGIALDQWLSATGQNPESFIEGLKAQSQKAVKVDLALRAVGVAQKIEVTDEDIESEYEIIAVRVQQSPAQVRKAYEQNDAVQDLATQIRKSKTLDWLLHNVEFVDADGNTLERDTVLGSSDHDHDYDTKDPE
ncbi:MAG: trigger factor [Ilumatobacteraceae bacterium]|nr:trigger factor [Ilumatobacteraceae bacterium]